MHTQLDRILCALNALSANMSDIRAHIHRHDRALGRIEGKLEHIMATLDEILMKVTEESTAIDSLIMLIDGIKQQLADALAGITLPTGVQEKIDAVFAGVEANKVKVQAAIDANVVR